MPIVSTELGAYLNSLDVGEDFDSANDFVFYYDVSGSVLKKMLLPAGGGEGGGITILSNQVAGAGGVSSFSLANIEATTGTLEIDLIARMTANFSKTSYTLNDDGTTNHYSESRQWGSDSYTNAKAQDNWITEICANDDPADSFAFTRFIIPAYASTTMKKMVLSNGVYHWFPTVNFVRFVSVWNYTTAINKVYFYPDSGNFAQYSRFTVRLIPGE